MKRHYTQMSEAEKAAIAARVGGLRVQEMVQHAVDRCNQKGVAPSDALKALTHGFAFEIHNDTPGDIRVGMRYTPQGKENSACVIVSLTRRSIVTVWPNHHNDNHRTLRINEYTWKQDARTTLSQLGDGGE
jgi:hypothetical protein